MFKKVEKKARKMGKAYRILNIWVGKQMGKYFTINFNFVYNFLFRLVCVSLCKSLHAFECQNTLDNCNIIFCVIVRILILIILSSSYSYGKFKLLASKAGITFSKYLLKKYLLNRVANNF